MVLLRRGEYQEKIGAFLNTLSHEDTAISALGPGQGMSAEAVRKCVRIGKQVTIVGLVYALWYDSEGVKHCKRSIKRGARAVIGMRIYENIFTSTFSI